MPHHRFIGTAFALALSLVGFSAAWSAERAGAADDTDEGHPAITVLDASARSAMAARLKADAQVIVVTRFTVVPGAEIHRKELPTGGCSPAPAQPAPEPAAAGAAPAATLPPEVVDKIYAQLSKRLARKGRVLPGKDAGQAPQDALVVTGCITRFEAGDPKKRFVGFNMGASRLGAHVRVSQKTRGALRPVAEFDLFIKGGNFMPPTSPIGLAMRVASINRQTLDAGAKRMGNRAADAIEGAFGIADE